MFTPIKTAMFAVVAIGAILLGSVAMGNSAHAESLSTPTQGFITLEVTPVCADNNAKVAYWKVVNKNADAEQISWTNYDNATSGSYLAAPGESKMTTGYDQAAGNNRTGFVWTNNVSSTNSSNTPCEAVTTPEEPTTPVVPPAACIDGKIQQNLIVTWSDDYSAVVVVTKDGTPVCEDVTLFLSSYVMPANYNGNGFYGNDTAYPQNKFSSVSVTLKKGMDNVALMAIDLPDACNNVQVDVYYGPEIVVVDSNGHGTQNIESQVIMADGSDCDTTTPGQGSAGGSPETPVTPTTPVDTVPTVDTTPPGYGAAHGTAETTALPAELPETGANANISRSLLLTLLAGLATYGILFVALPKRQN